MRWPLYEERYICTSHRGDRYHYLHDDHFIIFDSAARLKWADTAISARKMALNTSKPDNNWLVSPVDSSMDLREETDEGPNGPGIFKEMKVILEERLEFGGQVCDLVWANVLVRFEPHRCQPSPRNLAGPNRT